MATLTISPADEKRVKARAFSATRHGQLLRPHHYRQWKDHRRPAALHRRGRREIRQRHGHFHHPPDHRGPGHPLRQNRGISGVHRPGGPCHRRHRLSGAAHSVLQGHHLSVRPAGLLRPQRGDPPPVLRGLPHRKAAPQVQDRRGRLPQQLRKARPQRPGHHRPADPRL